MSTNSAVNPAFLRRSLERNAAFLVPHFKPELTVLDAGCGPGAITADIARLVAPGRVMGIDIDERSLRIAGEFAAAARVDNVSFQHGSILAIPFSDSTFDIAFAHAVLQHLEQPLEAVRELVRVVKPGGLIALVDADHRLSVLWPEPAELLASNALVERVRVAGKTSPRIGRELGRLLIETGCTEVWHRARETEPAAQSEAWSAARGQALLMRDERFRARARALPGRTEPAFDEMARAWENWALMPGATWVRPWFEALALKPR